MSDLIYKPLIEDMVWSFSRADSFDSCPYKWYLNYIQHAQKETKFYASYGTFVHKLIEQYYNGEISIDEMPILFSKNFKEEVKGNRPKPQILTKYIEAGANYFSNFQPFPFDCVAVEKNIKFDIQGIPFTAFIDYIGESNGDLYLVDHKSRTLKPRGKKYPAVITENDKALDHIYKQLYVYSAAIYKEYGKFPVELCINAFKSGCFIREPFDKAKYDEAIEWVVNEIHRIENTTDFSPDWDMFRCVWICDFSKQCACHSNNMKDFRRQMVENRRHH